MGALHLHRDRVQRGPGGDEQGLLSGPPKVRFAGSSGTGSPDFLAFAGCRRRRLARQVDVASGVEGHAVGTLLGEELLGGQRAVAC